MKNSVILKSFSSGISVILDSTIPYEELLLDVAAKFHDADHFFKNASVAISLEGWSFGTFLLWKDGKG